MHRNLRILIASIVAPLGVLIVPALISLMTLASEPVDTLDDAPIRAAGIILYVFIPWSYPLIAIIMCLVGFGLSALKRLKLRNLVFFSIGLSLCVGTYSGIISKLGLFDQLLSFIIFGGFTLLVAIIGSLIWWFIYTKSNNKKLQNIQAKTTPEFLN